MGLAGPSPVIWTATAPFGPRAPDPPRDHRPNYISPPVTSALFVFPYHFRLPLLFVVLTYIKIDRDGRGGGGVWGWVGSVSAVFLAGVVIELKKRNYSR